MQAGEGREELEEAIFFFFNERDLRIFKWEGSSENADVEIRRGKIIGGKYLRRPMVMGPRSK